jgi:solute carrier family 66 (lysosomal lysine-arginine transporter), member 1
VYYALADITLLCQCFYYKGFTLKDKITNFKPGDIEYEPDESTALLANSSQPINPAHADGQTSLHSLRDQYLSVDATHLSPATPLIPDPLPNEHRAPTRQATIIQGILFNAGSVILVCTIGVLGWWLKNRGANQKVPKTRHSIIQFSLPGQIFGYICAMLYLGSRIPQLLLNYRRKSTEGISMLFFLFAFVGNLTYVLSILAYGPVCERRWHCKLGEATSIYWRYIAVNLPWLIGSAGTLILDACVFCQYFVYRVNEDEEDQEDDYVPQADAQEAIIVSRSPRRAVEFDNDR